MERLPTGIIFRRMAAYAVDFLVLSLPLVSWQFGLSRLTGGWPFNLFQTGLEIEAWILLTISLPAWSYFILTETSARQATLGKRWLGLQVIGPDGGRISKGRALLRTAVKLLPWELTHLSLMLPTPLWSSGSSQEIRAGLLAANALIVLYLVVMFLDGRRRSLDDLAAGTQVI